MRTRFGLLAFLLLAACSKAPASIEPTQLSGVRYESWTCEQLAAEKMRLSIALSIAGPNAKPDVVSLEQETASPSKERGGDKQDEYEAISRAVEAKGCSTTQAMIEHPPAAKPLPIAKQY